MNKFRLGLIIGAAGAITTGILLASYQGGTGDTSLTLTAYAPAREPYFKPCLSCMTFSELPTRNSQVYCHTLLGAQP